MLYKKRIPYKRKTVIKKKTPYKRKRNTLVKTIQRVINKNEESKYVTSYAQNNTLSYYNSTTYYLTTFNLVPTIYQGTALGNRIGNQIHVSSHIVRYRLFIPQGATSTQPLLVRVFVGHIKPYPSLTPANVASGYNDLFRIGTGATSTPQNNDLDMMTNTNRDQWTIVYDKIHKIGEAGAVSGDPQATNNDFNISCTGRINLTKYQGKLIFNDTATNLPTNKSWFMFACIAPCGGASGTSGTTAVVNMTYDSQIYFKDA